MKINVKKPIDCPFRQLDCSEYTCGAVQSVEIVCDDDTTDNFPFPELCPLLQHSRIVVDKIDEVQK